jgi:hypothetical protein
MRVPGIPDITLNSGSITGLSYNTLYYVYYDDPGFLGGAVTYNATTTKETALLGAGRFFVGSIQTPRATAADTIGNNDGGSGAQNGQLNIFYPSAIDSGIASIVGNGAAANPLLPIDGDMTTAGTLSSTGNSGTNSAAITYILPSGITRKYSSVTLKFRRSLANTINGVDSAAYTAQWQTATSGLNVIEQAATGAALTEATVSVVLPTTLNLSQLKINFSVRALSGSTLGSITLTLKEVWIEAME